MSAGSGPRESEPRAAGPQDALVEAISDGAAADWTAAERAAGPGDRARIAVLRDLAKIADFHRGLQRADEGAPAPERWGELLVLERLGAGTRSEVFRAWDPELRREVALKRLRPGADDGALLEEARAAARVRHPNVVTVYGVDRHDDGVGLWMELVPGATVEQEVTARGRYDFATARRLGLEIGAALAAVHGAGLVHCDVKPANVVRAADGRFVLTDFGLGSGIGSGRTLAGTPMFMAPECLAGAPASERSDLYSLGMLLWFALTGSHPFTADSLDELLASARRGPHPPLGERRPDVPPALARAVGRAIAPDPGERFASVHAFTAALEDERVLRRIPWGRAVRGGLVAGALAVLLFWALARLGTGQAPAHRPVASPAIEPVPRGAASVPYSVEATFLRRDAAGATRLAAGDRVRPGDRLSLEMRVSRPAWVYVLDEDERGERYLLFPQPLFDARNPIPADSAVVLPGSIGGRESTWRVTSAGGRESFLVVVSPEAVPEIEAELGRLPAPVRGRPIDYARVGDAAVERLRGVGGVDDLPAGAAPPPAAPPSAFERFRALAGRETDVRGVWVRRIVLENPAR